MSRLPLVLFLIAGLAAGMFVYSRQDAAPVEAARLETDPAPTEQVNSEPGEGWSELQEQSRRIILDRLSAVEEKGGAFLNLRLAGDGAGADARTEDILIEAAWILANSSDSDLLRDVLAGIEGTQYPALLEPLVDILINHKSAEVREAAARGLHAYSDTERAELTLEHAAQYDADERVRQAASLATS